MAQQKTAYEQAKQDPLAAAMKENAELQAIGKPLLSRWKNGFFNLPWALIKELHEEKFTWGATFSHPDLHHFEL